MILQCFIIHTHKDAQFGHTNDTRCHFLLGKLFFPLLQFQLYKIIYIISISNFTMLAAAFFAASTLTATAAEAPPVSVELYFEAQCPGCQDFTTGALADTLADPEMAAIIDLKLVPYGNAKQTADGSFECQHGAGECESDAQELCTQYLLAGSNTDTMWKESMAAWPFILCMEQAEGNPAKGEGCYTSTMGNSTVSWSAVSSCVQNDFNLVTTAAMDATVKHDYVPWPLVDGTLLEKTNFLTKAVCDAYTGTKPTACGKHIVADTKEVSRCVNN